MESYVVRIYRRNSNNPQNLVGLVELVNVDEEKAFTNFEELWAILNCKETHAAEKKDRKTATVD